MSVRIQFDVSDEEAARFYEFIPHPKHRHGFAHKALLQWINREEGRVRNRMETKRKRGNL